jgi:hypothetical protein
MINLQSNFRNKSHTRKKVYHFHTQIHAQDEVTYTLLTRPNQPFSQPIHSVPDADAQWQHDSWPAQWCLFKFPGKDSHGKEAENDSSNFGDHVDNPLLIRHF